MSASFKHSNYHYWRILNQFFSRKKLFLPIFIAIMISLVPLSCWATCKTSNSNSYVITSVEDSFPTFTLAWTYGIVSSITSNYMYFLYKVAMTESSIVRKVNIDGSSAWMSIISFEPIIKSLALDASEQYIYFASFTAPMDVARLSANSGGIVDAQRQ